MWVEPLTAAPVEKRDRRLRKFAKRCAQELAHSPVPMWRSRYPRNGADSYRDAFWVVSVDVDAADRCFWQLEHRKNRWVKRKEPEFGGAIRGDALILTRLGGLFSTAVEMWFPPSGDHAEGNLDSLFHSPSDEHLEHSPWAGLNIGRWRLRPDSKVYGVVAATSCSEYKSHYPPGAFSMDDPGKGSSIALSKFMKSHRTQWPRYFGEFYGRY